MNHNVYVPEFFQGEKCPNCGEPILPGQVVYCWNDESDMHVDCNNPYSLNAEPTEEGNKPRVFLGDRPYYVDVERVKA